MARPGLRSPFQGFELGSDPGRIPDGAGRHPLRQGAAVDRTRGGAADLAAEGARQVTKALGVVPFCWRWGKSRKIVEKRKNVEIRRKKVGAKIFRSVKMSEDEGVEGLSRVLGEQGN